MVDPVSTRRILCWDGISSVGADSGRLERSFCFKSLLADISLPLCPCLGGFPTLHPKFLFCSFLSQLGTLSSPGYCNGNASLMPAWLLSPLRDVAGDSVMAACVCDPSFLIFWVFAFLLHLPCGLQAFPSLPSQCQGSIFSFSFTSILFSSAVCQHLSHPLCF